MPTTIAGTAYTVTAFTSSAGESCSRAVSDAAATNQQIPLVIFCHGNPGATASSLDSEFTDGYTLLRERIIDAGYAYVEGHGAGANWGNQAARTAYRAMYTDTTNALSVGWTAVIGRSMGALVGSYLASRDAIIAPRCRAYITLSGMLDLSNRYGTASATDKANMNAAYSVTTETGFWSAVSDTDPMLFDTAHWAGDNVLHQWAEGDTVAPFASNGQAWRNKYGPQLATNWRYATPGGTHTTTATDAAHLKSAADFLDTHFAAPFVEPGAPYAQQIVSAFLYDGAALVPLTLDSAGVGAPVEPPTPAPVVKAGALPVGNAAYTVPAGAVIVSPTSGAVAAAMAANPSGTTLVLRGGTYAESINVPASKAFTVQNYPGEAVWFDGGGTMTRAFTASNVLNLKGIGIRNYKPNLVNGIPDTDSCMVYYGGTSNGSLIENVVFQNSFYGALAVIKPDITVRSCTMQDGGFSGFMGTKCDRLLFELNVIQRMNRNLHPAEPTTGGLKITFADGMTIRDNHIEDVANAYGLWLDVSCTRFNIIRNTIVGAGALGAMKHCIEVELSDGGKYSSTQYWSNIISNTCSGAVGATSSGIKVFDTGNLRIWNNDLRGNSVPIYIQQDARYNDGSDPAKLRLPAECPWICANIQVVNNLLETTVGSKLGMIAYHDQGQTRVNGVLTWLLGADMYAGSSLGIAGNWFGVHPPGSMVQLGKAGGARSSFNTLSGLAAAPSTVGTIAGKLGTNHTGAATSAPPANVPVALPSDLAALLGVTTGTKATGPVAAPVPVKGTGPFVAGDLLEYGGKTWRAKTTIPRGVLPAGVGNGSVEDRDLLLSFRTGPAASVTGGYSGATYVVTTNANSGTGSLRAALESTDPLWIVFDKNVFSVSLPTNPIALAGNIYPRANKTIDGRGANVKIVATDPLYFQGIGNPNNATTAFVRLPGGVANVIMTHFEYEIRSSNLDRDVLTGSHGSDLVWGNHLTLVGGTDAVYDLTKPDDGGVNSLYGGSPPAECRWTMTWINEPHHPSEYALSQGTSLTADNQPSNGKAHLIGQGGDTAGKIKILMDHTRLRGFVTRGPKSWHGAYAHVINSYVGKWGFVPGAADDATQVSYYAGIGKTAQDAIYGTDGASVDQGGSLLMESVVFDPYTVDEPHLLDAQWPVHFPDLRAIRRLTGGTGGNLRTSGLLLLNGATKDADAGTVANPAYTYTLLGADQQLIDDLAIGAGNFQPWELV